MGKKSFSIRPFEKLKKKIETAQAGSTPPPRQRKNKEEYTDEELFTREMGDVQMIEEFRVLACRPGRRAVNAGPSRSDPDGQALMVLTEIANGRQPIHLPDTQEYVEWTNPAFHDAVIPKLHEGRFAVQAFLDLHGCTVPEAEAELDQFFQESFKKGYRCVKIIHGRGLRSVKGPRVKEAVIRRLSGHFRRDIIAFVTARQCDGGLGALYVLIGRK